MMVELPYELASVGVVTTKFVYGDHNTGSPITFFVKRDWAIYFSVKLDLHIYFFGTPGFQF